METQMISLIFPLYNERDNITHYHQDLFPIVDGIGEATGETFEYVFVDDGSIDDALQQITEIANYRNDCIVLVHEKNRGMGNAVKTGLTASKGELIITMDADLTFRPVDIAKLIER